MITWGRSLTVVYVAAVVAIAIFFVHESKTSVLYKAARELGANTRLTDADLSADKMNSIDDRLRLRRVHDQLVGWYLTHDTHKGEAIDADKVSPWPDLKDVRVTPVPLGAEPDQRMVNQGATVEVSIGEARKQLQVLAVVVSDGKWFALFRQAEIGDISKAEPKLTRVLSLPGVAQASPPPVPPKVDRPRKPKKPHKRRNGRRGRD
jgi:hypothetical protein